MPTHEEHIMRILGETTEPIFPSEIAERLNRELGPAGAYTSLEIVARLKRMSDQAAQLSDGRWMLKRFAGRLKP
jgi:predicted Zn-ribbon and HTH transcriptional regulator